MKQILFLALGLMVFLFGCTAGPKAYLKIWPPSNISQCETYGPNRTVDFAHNAKDCYLYLASKNNDSSICNNVGGPRGADLCKLDLAVGKRDNKYCDFISDAYLKDECHYYLAKSKNIGGYLCDPIVNESMKNDCLKYTR